MIRERRIRIAVPIVLALLVFGLAAAQSQLPGIALTIDPAQDLRPAWSPDGAQIAFFSVRSGNNDIWVMDADGENQRQLTTDPGDDRRPAWSPDGTLIAFDSDRAGRRDIWVMDTNGGDPRPLTSDTALDSFAAWSPDGGQIAFYAYDEGVLDMWVVAVDGFLEGGEAGQPQRVTNTLADERQNQCTFACHQPAWSPDSTRIAYQGENHDQIWVVGADGSDPHLLVEHESHGHDHFPWWTPDGRLLFLREHTSEQQGPVNDVWVMGADGSSATLLFADIPHGGPLYWHPDGSTTIAFHSPRAGNFDIYTTVLGQEASEASAAVVEPVVATEVPAPTAQAAAETAEPTAAPPATAEVAPESAAQTSPALILAVAAVVIGGGLTTIFLVRRRQ